MSGPLEMFFAAWGQTDPEERSRLVGEALDLDGTYADPMTPAPLVGPAPAIEYVAMFSENAPGATATVIDAQEQHGTTRATVEFEMADGHKQHGQYFVEFAEGGRISRMVGFVGTGDPAA